MTPSLPLSHARMNPPRIRNDATKCESMVRPRNLSSPPAAQTTASQGPSSRLQSLADIQNQTRDKTTADAPATRSPRTLQRRQQWKAPATLLRGVFCNDQFHVPARIPRSEEHTSELQSRGHLVCRLL